MNDVEQLAERYAAMWNEADPLARRRMIAELWSDDAAHFVRDLEYRGHERLEERVSGA